MLKSYKKILEILFFISYLWPCFKLTFYNTYSDLILRKSYLDLVHLAEKGISQIESSPSSEEKKVYLNNMHSLIDERKPQINELSKNIKFRISIGILTMVIAILYFLQLRFLSFALLAITAIFLFFDMKLMYVSPSLPNFKEHYDKRWRWELKFSHWQMVIISISWILTRIFSKYINIFRKFRAPQSAHLNEIE